MILPARMKDPTQEIKPDKKLLNGNVPTNKQYKNCRAPVSKMYSR